MLKKILAALAAFSVLATSSPTLAANRLNYYSGIIPSSQWQNLQERYDRLANGAFQTAIFGTGGSYQNLSVVPTSPTSLSVQVGPTNTSAVGSLYQFLPDDASAFGGGPINSSYALPPDPTLITVQGTTLANGNPIGPLTVPGSNSQISLIECQVVTTDTAAVSTNFISLLGTLQSETVNRDRDDQIICQSKAGTAAPSPTVPTVDTGYIAVGYVTIPSGTSTITSGMITASPSLGHAVMDGAASTQTIAGAKTFTQAVTAPSFIGDVPNKVFNVKSPPYNATGNGTTDDTAAIQAAASAAVVGGGALYFPQGQYKISSPIAFNLNGAGAAGGVRVYGAAGQARRSSSNGAIIEPTYASGDVFLVEQNQSNGAGGIIFDDFSVNRNTSGSTTPTNGGTFHLSGAAVSVTIRDVTTDWDYNTVQIDNNLGSADGGIWIDKINSENIVNDAFSISNGIGSAGGFIVLDSYFGGRGNTAGGTFMSLNVPSGTQIDPLYIKDVDVEAFAKGMLVEGGNSGFIVDGFIDGLLIDNTHQDSALRFLTNGAGGGASTSAISRMKIVNSWFESTAPGVAVVDIEANGTNSSYMNGADEFIIANSNINAGASHGIVVAGGAADVLLNGNMIYANGDCGVFIGQAQHVTVTGNRIGDVYGSGNSKGLCLNPPSGKTADSVTITGNDIIGNASNAIVADTSGGGSITNFSVTGNNLGTNYTTPVSFPGSAVGYFADNLGYNSASGAPSGSCPNGAIYTNATGGSGSTLYACYSNGWHAATTP